MRIAIIDGTTLLKCALEQVPSLKSFNIEFFEESETISGYPDICIFNEVIPQTVEDNQIIISAKFKANLNKPFKLISLVELIIDKLNQKTYTINKVKFFPSKRTLELEENLIILTEKEAKLVLYLVNNYPRGIPKGELLKEIWEYSTETETSTVEVHLSRLKQKLIESSFPDFLTYKDKFLYIEI